MFKILKSCVFCKTKKKIIRNVALLVLRFQNDYHTSFSHCIIVFVEKSYNFYQIIVEGLRGYVFL